MLNIHYSNRKIHKSIYSYINILFIDFAAVLTGQSTKSSSDFKKLDFPPIPMQQTGLDYVATGRFTFYKKHLYFSFYTNKPKRPRLVQFIDPYGNIIEEIVCVK